VTITVSGAGLRFDVNCSLSLHWLKAHRRYLNDRNRDRSPGVTRKRKGVVL
jgi:hypothetical protein